MNNTLGRVLIVDDETVNIKVLVAALDGFDTIIAKNGKQAVEKAHNQRAPDLILLDVNMPNKSGYEVCTELKSDPETKEIPIIFITVNSTVEEETKGLEMGAVDYITKPFSPGIVLARVTNQIQLKKQRDMLERLNLTDSLTGIANRRCFDEHLAYEWKQASRANSHLSLIMVDIDHFKNINDLKGHAYGDECLQKVAKRIASCLSRTTDIVARYGGEEFAVVLSYTDNDGALKVAQIIRNSVKNLNIPHPNSTTGEYLTISLGVATLIPSPSESPINLIECADKQLYQAKRNGRDRVN